MIRNPAVAGQFYPGSKTALLREVESLIDSKATKRNAIAVISPHAGYAYSGSVAGCVLSSVKPKNNYIIIGPNHTGIGKTFGIDTSNAWKTPLGEVRLNRSLAEEIEKNSRLIEDDNLSHVHEHSIEVQIPFMQVLQEDFTFVPMTVKFADLKTCRDIGAAIAKAVKGLKIEGDLTIIASSDMTHYEPQETAKRKDEIAIKAMLELDEEALFERVTGMDITMCGFVPAVITMVAAKALGANSARLLRYQTSGDTTGDYSSVVGYAGILIE